MILLIKNGTTQYSETTFSNVRQILEISPALSAFFFFVVVFFLLQMMCGLVYLVNHELTGGLGVHFVSFVFSSTTYAPLLKLGHIIPTIKQFLLHMSVCLVPSSVFPDAISFSVISFSLFLYSLTGLRNNMCSLKCNHSGTKNDFLVLI